VSLSSENFDSFGVTGTENPPPTTLHNHSAIRAVSNNRSFRPDTTYENSQIRSVDLMKMDLNARDITRISMKGGEVIKSLNPS
jgi:penicillin V acylase-like amidase (Ntn superfamily)